MDILNDVSKLGELGTQALLLIGLIVIYRDSRAREKETEKREDEARAEFTKTLNDLHHISENKVVDMLEKNRLTVSQNNDILNENKSTLKLNRSILDKNQEILIHNKDLLVKNHLILVHTKEVQKERENKSGE